MNREQAKQLLPIIQAFADGQDVQFRSESGGWTDLPPWACPVFTDPSQYRIKPKPLERWAVIDCDFEFRGDYPREVVFSTRRAAQHYIDNHIGDTGEPFRIAKFREVTE